MRLLLLVPDALRGQANSGRASRSASFSDPASPLPRRRMPDAELSGVRWWRPQHLGVSGREGGGVDQSWTADISSNLRRTPTQFWLR